jgi:DNA-binding GntR family transcriptional regulator
VTRDLPPGRVWHSDRQQTALDQLHSFCERPYLASTRSVSTSQFLLYAIAYFLWYSGEMVTKEPAGGLPWEPLSRPDSLADRVYKALRERIALRALEPGERLTERGLALLLGVSPTPVREAIVRLEHDGLVMRNSPRTLTVAEHSDEVLRELLFGEAVLRAALTRIAAGKITDSEVTELFDIVAELERAAATAEIEDVLAIARRFDAIVERAAASPVLARLAGSAGIVSYGRRLQAVARMREEDQPLGRRHLAAHRAIADALRDHDGDRAERLTREHLLSSLQLLLSDIDTNVAKSS